MQFNEIQLQEFKRTFAVRKKRQMVMVVPFVLIGIGIAAIDRGTQMLFGIIPAAVFVPVALAAIAGGAYFSFKNWRCPACDKYLGRSFSVDFCPKCGVPLK